jgi:tetratricopeptide (TPR) repeat protein
MKFRSVPRNSLRRQRPAAAARLLTSALLLGLLAGVGGCSELRGRYLARQGNQSYLAGEYAQAVDRYQAAEAWVPELPALVLNKGLACRQLILPGAKSKDSEGAVNCALSSFERLKVLAPGDPRGDQLYVQTLFDADRFDELIRLYQGQHQARPTDLAPVNGLIQVYARADRWDELLEWTQKRSQIADHDSEAAYAVGVLIWNRLFQKGGGPDRAAYDPRPEAKQSPPLVVEGDVTGEARARLADVGLKHLERALALRPNYREAVIYLNLLERQKAYAYFEQPELWQASIARAETWRQKAAELAGTTPAASAPNPEVP